MNRKSLSLFAYIAFDEASKGVLAYGSTATDALCWADKAAPNAPIYILEAGNLGLIIWNSRMDLTAATENLLPRLQPAQPLKGQFT